MLEEVNFAGAGRVRSRASAAAHAGQHKEAVQISSLKGDQISAQGLTLGRYCPVKCYANKFRS